MTTTLLVSLALFACDGTQTDDSATDTGTIDNRPDRDGDGVPDEDDCDPDDPWTYPGANDIPYDGKDNDCMGDGDLTDVDGDGYDGDSMEDGTDCNDSNPTIYPGADEVCYNGIDENCDGVEDTNDCDGDGYDGRGDDATDCDDENADVHPGQDETWYDGIDGDCSGHIDSDYDQDGDGHEDPSNPEGGEDCDDTDPLTYPGNKETWDGADNDCDEVADGLSSRDADLTWSGDWFSNGDGLVGLGGDVIGDVTGDGVPEIAVGGYGTKDSGYSGYVYVLDTTAADGDFSDTAAAWIFGSSEYLGWDLAGPGDLNGDGTPDLVMGAPLAAFGSTYGGAYIVDPADALGSTYENVSGIAWATLSAHMDYAGADVEALGDMNGDGVSEVAVGTAFITSADLTIYASNRIANGGNLTTTSSLARISDSSHYGGQTVGGLDFDADGMADLLFGSDTQPADKDAGYPGPGNGRVSPFSGADLFDSPGGEYVPTDVVGLTGNTEEGAGNVSGWLPDIDGDGYDEIVVSLWGHHGDESQGNWQAGAVAVLDGHVYTALSSDAKATTVAEYLVYGIEDLGHLRSAEEGGDFDGDEVGDLVVISIGDIQLAGLNSLTNIHHGPDVIAGGTASASDSVVEFTSIAQDDLMGWNTLSTDLDGNGLDDLIQTAPYGTGYAGSVIAHYNLLDRFD